MTTPWPLVVTSVGLRAVAAGRLGARRRRRSATTATERRRRRAEEAGFVSYRSYAADLLCCHTCATGSSTAAGRSTIPTSDGASTWTAHIPGAVFVDVEQRPLGTAGAGRPASAADGGAVRSRRLALRASRPGVFVVAYGSTRRRRAALVAAAPLRPRRLRRARPRGLARPAARRRRGGRSRRAFVPRRAARRHDRPRDARRAARRARRRRRPRPRPLARRAEPDRPGAGPDPGRAQRAVERAACRRCRRASSSPTAARASPPASSCTALHLAGRDGRLYPGSWSEWEQHPELPVERSEPA